MKSMHSVEIEAVKIQWPTGQLGSPTDTSKFLTVSVIELPTSQLDSLTGAPSIAVANYNDYNTIRINPSLNM